MLPLENVKVCYTEDAPDRAIGWYSDFPGETFLVGMINDQGFLVSVGGEKMWSTAKWEVGSFGAFVTDFEFRVDPRSFVRFDELESKIGALVVHNQRAMVCAPHPQNGRGYLRLDVGEVKGEWPPHHASAFTRWQVITHVGENEIVLLSHEAKPEAR